MVGGPERRALELKGFEEAERFDDADVQITFEIHGVKLASDIESKQRTVKKDDKEVTITEYYYTVSAKPAGQLLIQLKDGQKVYNSSFSGKMYEHNIKSVMYKTKSAAVNAYKKSEDSILEETSRDAVKNVTNRMSYLINDKYGYYYYGAFEKICSGKSKKHDYGDLNELLATFKQAVDLYNQKDYEAYSQLAKECIAGWEKALTEFNPNDKKAAKKGRINKKIADRLHYNIAAAYLYMNQFDKATLYTKNALLIDASLGGRNLLNEIDTKKIRYQKNQQRENKELVKN